MLMRRVVITGATSMIGVALMKALLKDSEVESVYAVVRPDSFKMTRFPKDSRIRIVYCDMKDYCYLPDKIGEQCDVFYHLAWERTATYDESVEDMLVKCRNIEGEIYAIGAAIKMKCRSFVGVGTHAEYGNGNGNEPYAPNTICNPTRADGVAHFAAKKMIERLSNNCAEGGWTVYG